MFLSQFDMGDLQNHQLRLNQEDHEHGLLVQESKPAIRKPPMYQVVMLNDDYSPMEFVVYILETFFGMSKEKATRIMLQVHNEGKAICGIFTKDVAETKVLQVSQCAKDHEHPLLCKTEAIED